MQDHAKQGYIFGHLSLIRSLALDIPSGFTIVKDGEIRPLKKERYFLVLFRVPLFLGKWYGVVTYFYTKKRKTKYKKYMTELYHSH